MFLEKATRCKLCDAGPPPPAPPSSLQPQPVNLLPSNLRDFMITACFLRGYYQPAGPLISHLHHGGSSISGALPSVSGTASGKGVEPQSSSSQPQPPSRSAESDALPHEYRPPPAPAFPQGYPPHPPPPHPSYNYPYIQQPYQDCYATTYIHKYTPPGFRRYHWGVAGSSQMVTSEPYPPPPQGGAFIEHYPPSAHHPNYYYPAAAPPAPPPPQCYSHPPQQRPISFIEPSSFQNCPCPMQTCPKNVLSGPLTGASKGSSGTVQAQIQQLQTPNNGGMMEQQQQVVQQQQQQQQSSQGATQPAPLPPVALALPMEPNGANHGPPSPARGSAGMPPPASPALSTARNPPSWSPPNISGPVGPTKEEPPSDGVSPPPDQTVVSDTPPVLENQVTARRPRPPKRKPSIEPEVFDVPKPLPLAVEPPPTKRRRSSSVQPHLTRGQTKKSETPVVQETKTKPLPNPKLNSITKLNGIVKAHQKPAPVPKPNGLLKSNGIRQKKESQIVKCKNKIESKKNCKKSPIEEEPLPCPIKMHPTSLKWSNGWSWEGEPYKAKIFLTCDESPVFRKCYPAMRHIEGDIIYPMDCILLKSGPRKQQLPFVAKVASMWENPEDGEMMISLLWYYRPEHTEQGRLPLQPDDEIFASRHKDTNSVACIEDKCYVLTYNEYCRYKKSVKAAETGLSFDSKRAVPPPEDYPRSNRLPPGRIANELLFFCRKVYDFRTKRILKKPNVNIPAAAQDETNGHVARGLKDGKLSSNRSRLVSN